MRERGREGGRERGRQRERARGERERDLGCHVTAGKQVAVT